jgi:hypothetical protein
MRYEDLLDLIRHLLVAIPVDEVWYRSRYPDVARSIAASNFASASGHYVQHGYFEGRQPFEHESETCGFPVPFTSVEATLEVTPGREGLQLHISNEQLCQLLCRFLGSICVDQEWYCNTYPSVSQAIGQGKFPNAMQHFMRHGYLEGRWPFDMYLDEPWYLDRYPDVKPSIDAGAFQSAREHYQRVGYRQGRLPARFWFVELWDRAWVAKKRDPKES